MSKLIRHACVAAVALLAVTVSIAQAGQAKVNLTGTWVFEVTTDQGGGTPTVTLKQDGEKLTGHYSSSTLGEADLNGTVKGNDVNFTFNADVQGQAAPVVYKCTIESATTMKGTLNIAGAINGTFTGTKK